MIKNGAGRGKKALIQQPGARTKLPYQKQYRGGYGINQQAFGVIIYNIHGQLVRTLINQRLFTGIHQISWNGRDDHLQLLSGGVYLYRLQTSAGFMETMKFIYLK